jgi:Kef-type K+ transport system membrane component KefB
MRLVLLIVLCILMDAARSFSSDRPLSDQTSGVALAGGFLLLVAFLAGSIFRDLHLPRLTGYLVAGIVIGPYALGLVSAEMVVRLDLFSGIAISLIALTAGAETDLRQMRPLFRSIGAITVIAVVGAMACISGAVYMLSQHLSFLAALEPLEAAAVSVTIGVMLAAQSPAVAVALRDEMQAEGDVTRTVLGVVVVSDVVVIMCFALASSVTRGVLGLEVMPGSSQPNPLIWEIGGSLVLGTMIGVLISAYLRFVHVGASLTIVLLGFVVAEVGQRANLDPLLLALGAGIFVRNLTDHSERLLKEIRSASMPIYVIFFALAGAGVHMDVIPALLGPIFLLVMVRGVALMAGTAIATRITCAPPAVQRYAGFGLLPQAGLALALAMLLARTFPDLGPEAAALVFGIVAVNEVLSPILYRHALVRSGEAGKYVPG